MIPPRVKDLDTTARELATSGALVELGVLLAGNRVIAGARPTLALLLGEAYLRIGEPQHVRRAPGALLPARMPIAVAGLCNPDAIYRK